MKQLKADADDCRRCDLWRHATQAVVGSGPATSRIMFVGEQPGDIEDREGEPFVGPAGRLLREAFEQAGIDPGEVYLTNAVKHFKWEPRGKRRIHLRPNTAEVAACHLWMDAEIATVKPLVLVALGATAAKALLGADVRVTRDRGRAIESSLAPYVTVTVHPSSILRAGDAETRTREMSRLVADLRAISAQARRLRRRRLSQ